MPYWETADEDPTLDDSKHDWAALSKPFPKAVFSTTLTEVQGGARLASGGLAEEIEPSTSANAWLARPGLRGAVVSPGPTLNDRHHRPLAI
ncbi:hypothetical protein [Actinomadura luteofluorescens]|uniref:hypothetical protein n=1 Tax=Actinomadura luteofluorescens TaxID=46163 RepID=UPI003D89D9EA